MTIAIRPARLADALGMATVHHAAVHAALPGVYDRAVRDNWAPPVDLARAEQLYREAQDNGELAFVAEMHDEIAGFVLVHPGRGELAACYVAPQAARRGIGRALYRAAEAAAAGCSELRVRSSRNAEAFYRSVGFVIVSRGESRFTDGTTMPVVFMRKSLTPPSDLP